MKLRKKRIRKVVTVVIFKNIYILEDLGKCWLRVFEIKYYAVKYIEKLRYSGKRIPIGKRKDISLIKRSFLIRRLVGSLFFDILLKGGPNLELEYRTNHPKLAILSRNIVKRNPLTRELDKC